MGPRVPRGTGDLYVWLMNGKSVVSAKYPSPSRFSDTRWQLVHISDFNEDGQVDLLWQHATTGDLYVWHMNCLTAVGRVSRPRPAEGPGLERRAALTSTPSGHRPASSSVR
jgi:hypothetical protein